MPIIGVLVALMLPAIQAVARIGPQDAVREQSQADRPGNARLLASAHGHFPRVTFRRCCPTTTTAVPAGRGVRCIMPFIEEVALHDQIDFNASLRGEETETRALTSLPLFICPSDDEFEPIIDIPSKSSTRIICRMAAGNYVA